MTVREWYHSTCIYINFGRLAESDLEGGDTVYVRAIQCSIREKSA